MRRFAFAVLFLIVPCAFAQSPPVHAARADAAASGPLSQLPYTPGLDPGAMDRTADPCVDFYQYSCGGWMRDNPIPADQSRWSVYSKLAQDNRRFLWGILDTLARDGATGRTAAQQKIGDYFAACMDEAAVERRGAAPLAPFFAQIDGMASKQALPRVLAQLHQTLGGGLFFDFGAGQDYADSSQLIAFANAGGLGLPDRDYYLNRDAKSQALRTRYAQHVAATLVLLGDAPDTAARRAATVIRIETALAKATLSRVDKRDPHQLFHKVSLGGLQKLTPGFDWRDYLAATGLAQVRVVNVSEPHFYRALDAQWRQLSLADIQTYLRWQTARTMAPYLSTPFVNADFGFYRKALRGVPELQPRWKRCVTLVDDQLGEALGQEFVDRAFSPALKAQTLRMTRQIEQAMQEDIASLSWMSPDTRQRAQDKLRAVVNKIGYPDRWRDYGGYAVARDDFAGNVTRGQRFEARRQLAKIGKPLDRAEWDMTPPTVNAYYNPQMNDINFPAGVLQPPLFDSAMDDAPNYGNTGATIGHELTHGFDDEGRQFDAKGNLKDWWGRRDAAAFTERAQCLVDQYAQYTVVDDLKINSQLTLGEDVADLGGLILGWMAWQAQIAQTPPPAPLRDGLTPEQRFFVGYAQWACENNRPEDLRVSALTDPHSPGKFRVNGLMVNMPEFEKAFSCKPGQPMVSPKRCRVW